MTDQFDDELKAALQSRAGRGAASTAAAHDAVLARAGHIRRRRVAVVGGGATVALLIGGIALLPRGGSDSLAPSQSGDMIPSVDAGTTTTAPPDDGSDIGATTTTSPGSTTIEATDAAAIGDSTTTSIDVDRPANTPPGSTIDPAPTTPSETTTSVGSGTSTTTTPAVAGTTTVTIASTTTTTPSGTTTTAPVGTTTTAPSTTEPDDPLPGPFTETYTSLGGSITVNWDGSALSLLSLTPEPGFESEVKDNTSTRIRVDFDDGESDSRIEVRLDGTTIDVTIS